MGEVKLYFLPFSRHLFLDFFFFFEHGARISTGLPGSHRGTYICVWLSKSMFLWSLRAGISYITILLTSPQASPPLILKRGFLSLYIFKRVDLKALSSKFSSCVFSGVLSIDSFLFLCIGHTFLFLCISYNLFVGNWAF